MEFQQNTNELDKTINVHISAAKKCNTELDQILGNKEVHWI
jgi:hypothetical protein